MVQATGAQIRWFRQRRSGLAEAFDSPEDAAGALAGVQAQILTAAALALRNRCAAGAATFDEIAARLFDTRSLIRLWGQRKTLHLYASKDWPLVNAAFADRMTWWEREAARGGAVDLAAYREGTARVAKLLRKRGHLSRSELRESGLELPAALLSPWGGVFAELARQGVACLARWEGGEARYAHRTNWLPGLDWSPPDAAGANIELARRYFRCYGPASVGDLAYWHGASIGAASSWAAALGDELAEVHTHAVPSRKQYILTADLPDLHAVPPAPDVWPVRLLGRFDPLLLAHKDKDWIVPRPWYSRVWRPAGHIEAIVLDQGHAVATWRYDRIGTGRLRIRVFPFRARLPVRVSKAARRLAREVAHFFGLKLAEVRMERFGPGAPSSPDV